MVYVASALARTGFPEAAVLTLRRATERHPDSPVLFAALGRIWLMMAAEDDDPIALGKAIEALQPLARLEKRFLQDVVGVHPSVEPAVDAKTDHLRQPFAVGREQLRQGVFIAVVQSEA